MKRIFIVCVLFSIVCGITAKTYINIVTDNTQLSMQVKDDGRLYQTYLGERLLTDNENSSLSMPNTNATSSATAGNEVYPVMGTEDYFEPAFAIRHNDGNPTSVLKYVSSETKSVDPNVSETLIKMRDNVYPLFVTLHYVAYKKENIIKTWSEISHKEKGSVVISRYASSMLYFEYPSYYLTQFSSDWAREMNMSESKLLFGKKVIDTRLGARSAMLAPPFFEVGLGSKVSENEGCVLMGTIAWTGNYRSTFEVDNNNELRVISGINPDASEYELKAGETFTTPEFIFTLSYDGAGQGSRNFHHWAMNYQLAKGKSDRMTLLNNWENTGFDFNEDKLSSLLSQAKDLGVDMFLLDDGWFANKYPRNNDNAGLGDWEVNHKKLPDGLPFLVKTAEKNGVKFGLWIEPEMVNPKSELAEKHPDWIIRLPNRDTYYFRNQLVLDLCNPQVQNYVFSIVDNILTENPTLAFFKWDCNSPITNIYSPYLKNRQSQFYIDYVRGLYKVLDKIKAKCPDLDMMLCSGGGARCDYEALKYFCEFWCSDDTDPVERIYIQWGFSQFMPSKAMCSHITNWNAQTSIKFRTDVAMSCKLGYDIDLKKLSDSDMQFSRSAIKEYNRLKPLIYDGDLYRLVSPYTSNHCVIERVDANASHAILFSYDIHPRYGEKILPVRLQGLNPQAKYRVKEVNMMPGNSSWYSFNDKTFSGDYLMKIGLPVLTTSQTTSHILEITEE